MPSGVKMRRLAGKVALCCLACVVALSAGEGLVRLAGIGPTVFQLPMRFFRLSPNPLLRYEHIPNTTYGEYAINEHGLRGPAFEQAKPADVFRVAVVGDSVAFGWDVGAGEPWPEVLQGLLNAHDLSRWKRFQVLNFSVTGYNATQIAETVLRKVEPWTPDLILYAYCLNDPQEFSTEFEELLDQLSPRRRSWIAGQSGRFLRRSRIVQLLALGWTHRGEAAQRSRKTTWHDDPQYQALQSGQGVAYFAAIHEDPRTFQRVEDAFAKLAASGPTMVCFFPLFSALDHAALRAVHRKVDQTAARHGLPTFDLTPYLVAARRRGIRISPDHDPLHLTPQGHAVAAKAILHALVSHLQEWTQGAE
jgi:lysophospholipase L1-like esterase